MGGPVYDRVLELTGKISFVNDYLFGGLDRQAFKDKLVKEKQSLLDTGINEWWLGLLRRFPKDIYEPAQQMADKLCSSGYISDCRFDRDEFDIFRKHIIKDFEHLPDRNTSIFPEEAAMSFALSMALKPKRVFVAGSYYCYLAVWLIPGLKKEGHMVCSDVDKTVCELAVRNMKALGVENRVSIKNEDAIELLRKSDEPIDLLVLDAYGSYDDPEPEKRGKAIYKPLLQAALPRLHDKSILLVHNAEVNSNEMKGFFEMLKDVRFSFVPGTTDNLAVYIL
jgi:predicted O-methyltransferase YrrM